MNTKPELGHSYSIPACWSSPAGHQITIDEFWKVVGFRYAGHQVELSRHATGHYRRMPLRVFSRRAKPSPRRKA